MTAKFDAVKEKAAPSHLVEQIAVYIESESECLMPIVVEETKLDYGVRLLKVMAGEIREKFKPRPGYSSIPDDDEHDPKSVRPKPQGGDCRPHYRKDEVDAYINRLEYERDVWRGKCRMLRRAQPDSASAGTERQAQAIARVIIERDDFRDAWEAAGETAKKQIRVAAELRKDRDRHALNAVEMMRQRDELSALHREIIDLGRKVLNATSDKGLSQTEYIEWAIDRLERR